MALINCPECGHGVSSDAKACPRCGHPIAQQKSDGGCATGFGVLFVIAGFFFWPLWILAVLLFILAAVEKNKD